MKQFQLNLPSESVVIGDKAYNDYHTTTMISKIFSKKPPESTFDRCDGPLRI
jgi:hypothetical protein